MQTLSFLSNDITTRQSIDYLQVQETVELVLFYSLTIVEIIATPIFKLTELYSSEFELLRKLVEIQQNWKPPFLWNLEALKSELKLKAQQGIVPTRKSHTNFFVLQISSSYTRCCGQ